MSDIWWMLVGVAAGVVIMLPVIRLLLRRGERRIRQAERRARDAERLAELGSMTGGLAHEIKNPLSTIGLNAQLLSEAIGESTLLQDQKDRLLRRIETLSREVERLRGILTDFLQFAGRIKIDPQPRDLAQIVDEICDFFLPQAQQAGITLRTQLPNTGETLMVRVDEGLLKQSLLNLMLNATQAMSEHRAGEKPQTANHELILRVEADAQEARIHVIDTGPGIDAAKIEDIFHPYVSLRSGGTGLGLPTSRRIVQEHGGRLTVHSEVGKGSDFTIHLPRGTPKAA